MDEFSFEHRSFGERHPVLAGIAVVAFIVVAGLPLIGMNNERIACKTGANDLWCPADSEHRHLHPDSR